MTATAQAIEVLELEAASMRDSLEEGRSLPPPSTADVPPLYSSDVSIAPRSRSALRSPNHVALAKLDRVSKLGALVRESIRSEVADNAVEHILVVDVRHPDRDIDLPVPKVRRLARRYARVRRHARRRLAPRPRWRRVVRRPLVKAKIPAQSDQRLFHVRCGPARRRPTFREQIDLIAEFLIGVVAASPRAETRQLLLRRSGERLALVGIPDGFPRIDSLQMFAWPVHTGHIGPATRRPEPGAPRMRPVACGFARTR